MLGIELIEIVSFFKQLGLALSGSAALWGYIFLRKSKKVANTEAQSVFSSLSKKIMVLFWLGSLTAMLAWLVILFVVPANAHEGITIHPSAEHTEVALQITTPVFAVFIIFLIVGFILFRRAKTLFEKHLSKFYLASFAVIFFLISLPAWTGRIDADQLFFAGHYFHSIFTLGTVIVVDFLILLSESSEKIKRHLFPFMPAMSKVIWVGLGIDFLSVSLIFEKAIALTPKFYFMQTLVGIIILNGAFLSGPMNRKLISLIEKGRVALLDKKWRSIASISGVLSIASWTTITLTDTFKNLTATYPLLLSLYALILLIFYLVHKLIDRNREKLLGML